MKYQNPKSKFQASSSKKPTRAPRPQLRLEPSRWGSGKREHQQSTSCEISIRSRRADCPVRRSDRAFLEEDSAWSDQQSTDRPVGWVRNKCRRQLLRGKRTRIEERLPKHRWSLCERS